MHIPKLKDIFEDEMAFAGLVNVAIVLIVLVAVFIVAAVIGDKLEYSNGLQLSTTSQWNSSVNTKIVTGRSIWENNASLISIAVTVGIIGIVIGYIIDFGGMRTGRSGGQ